MLPCFDLGLTVPTYIHTYTHCKYTYLGSGGDLTRQFCLQPRLYVRLPSHLAGVKVHHAAATNGGGGRHGEILDLEHHVYGGSELDSLAVCETQHLIIIEDSVHVLDPQCVDRTVAHDPFVVVGGVFDALTYNGGH